MFTKTSGRYILLSVENPCSINNEGTPFLLVPFSMYRNFKPFTSTNFCFIPTR